MTLLGDPRPALDDQDSGASPQAVRAGAGLYAPAWKALGINSRGLGGHAGARRPEPAAPRAPETALQIVYAD